VQQINPQRELALKLAQLNSDLTYTHAELSAVNGVRRAERQKDYVVNELKDPRSFYSVGLTIFEPSAIAHSAGQAFATWLLHGDILDTTSNFFSGFGDFLTLGGTAYVREWAGTDHFIDRNSFAYSAGAITGMVVQTIITSGAGQACGTASWAMQLARGYSMIVNIHTLGVSLYNVATGRGTLMDVITIALTTAAGIKYLRGGCFVGETLVVLDDGRQLPMADEIIADAGTTTFIPGLDMQELGGFVQSLVLVVGILGLAITEAEHRRRQAERTAQDELDALFGPPDNDDEEDEDDSMPYISDDDWLDPLAEEHAASRDAFDDEMEWTAPAGDRVDASDSSSHTSSILAPSLAPTVIAERLARVRSAPHASPTPASPAKQSFFNLRILGLFWLLACLAIVGGWKAFNAAAPAKIPTTQIARKPELVTQKISEVPVGQWVIAENPEQEDFDDFLFDDEDDINPADWRKITLTMVKPDDTRLDIELLRPVWWLEAQNATIGQSLELDLSELGAEGSAEVLAIDPCPVLAPRPSSRHHLVTGKFSHQVEELIDIYIEGIEDPITCTPNHLFWLEDLQKFVAAGELSQGQVVDALSRKLRISNSVSYRSKVSVFNLEVGDHHVYRVGSCGILVHNICTPPRFDSSGRVVSAYAHVTLADIGKGTAATSAARAMARTLGTSTDDAGHLIAKVLGGKGGKRAGNIFPALSSTNRGQMATIEKFLAKEVRLGKDVHVRVTLKYSGTSTRPDKIVYQYRIDGVTTKRVLIN
jgi:hypothetical protein